MRSLRGEEIPSARNRECAETDSEVVMQPRAVPPRPADHEGLRFPMVGSPVHFKPEPYDGSSDWPEYLVYFEQLAEVHGWDHPTMAMVLGLSLRGSARSVMVNLTMPQRRDYKALKSALTQHFCPPQQVHLYQAELKARKRKPDESLPDLGRDIARLIRLAYPTADLATRENWNKRILRCDSRSCHRSALERTSRPPNHYPRGCSISHGSGRPI